MSEIAQAFREIFKKKAKKLEEEEKREEEGLPPIQEAETIGDTQRKFLSYQKLQRAYPFKVQYPVSKNQKKMADVVINAYLSSNEDKAFKQLLNEVLSVLKTVNPDNYFEQFKEMSKVLRSKSKDFSDDMLSAISNLLEQTLNVLNDMKDSNKFTKAKAALISTKNFLDSVQFEKEEYEEPEGVMMALNTDKAQVNEQLRKILEERQKRKAQYKQGLSQEINPVPEKREFVEPVRQPRPREVSKKVSTRVRVGPKTLEKQSAYERQTERAKAKQEQLQREILEREERQRELQRQFREGFERSQTAPSAAAAAAEEPVVPAGRKSAEDLQRLRNRVREIMMDVKNENKSIDLYRVLEEIAQRYPGEITAQEDAQKERIYENLSKKGQAPEPIIYGRGRKMKKNMTGGKKSIMESVIKKLEIMMRKKGKK